MRPQVTPFRRPAVAALALVIGLNTLNAGAIVEVQGQTRTKRVAILAFDYSAVRSAAAALFGTDIDVGQGISDMLVTALVNDGTYSVIEREMLDGILAEQNLANSSRASAGSAARIGQVLGVDAIITGSVTQFGRDTSSTGIGSVGSVGRRFGFGGFDRSETRAIVAVDARIVNVDTAEILAVAQGKGESSRTSTSILGEGEAVGAVSVPEASTSAVATSRRRSSAKPSGWRRKSSARSWLRAVAASNCGRLSWRVWLPPSTTVSSS